MNMKKIIILRLLCGMSFVPLVSQAAAWTATQNTLWLQAQESMQRAGGDMDILREFSSGLQQHGGLDAYNYLQSKMSSLPPRVWRALADVCYAFLTKPSEKKFLMQRIIEDDISAATNDRDLQLKIENQIWQNPFPARQYLQEIWEVVQSGHLNATDLRLYGARYSWFLASLQKDMTAWITSPEVTRNKMKDIWAKVQNVYATSGGGGVLAYVDQASKDSKNGTCLSDTGYFKKDLIAWLSASDEVLKTSVGAAAAKIENEIRKVSKVEGQKYGTLWFTAEDIYHQRQDVAGVRAYLQQNAANIPPQIIQDISAYIMALYARDGGF